MNFCWLLFLGITLNPRGEGSNNWKHAAWSKVGTFHKNHFYSSSKYPISDCATQSYMHRKKTVDVTNFAMWIIFVLQSFDCNLNVSFSSGPWTKISLRIFYSGIWPLADIWHRLLTAINSTSSAASAHRNSITHRRERKEESYTKRLRHIRRVEMAACLFCTGFRSKI